MMSPQRYIQQRTRLRNQALVPKGQARDLLGKKHNRLHRLLYPTDNKLKMKVTAVFALLLASTAAFQAPFATRAVGKKVAPKKKAAPKKAAVKKVARAAVSQFVVGGR